LLCPSLTVCLRLTLKIGILFESFESPHLVVFLFFRLCFIASRSFLQYILSSTLKYLHKLFYFFNFCGFVTSNNWNRNCNN
jgi:hypothetical protein